MDDGFDAYWEAVLKKNLLLSNGGDYEMELSVFRDAMHDAYLSGYNAGLNAKPLPRPRSLLGMFFGGD